MLLQLPLKMNYKDATQSLPLPPRATHIVIGTPDTTSFYFRGGAKEACLFRASLSQAR
jgi:hypothetical protein